MPRRLERRLAREAAKKGYTGRRRARYIYGTLTNLKKRRKKR